MHYFISIFASFWSTAFSPRNPSNALPPPLARSTVPRPVVHPPRLLRSLVPRPVIHPPHPLYLPQAQLPPDTQVELPRRRVVAVVVVTVAAAVAVAVITTSMRLSEV